MKIALGCDHAGYELKDLLIKHLESKGITTVNKGCNGPESVDYPDYAHLVADDVEKGKVDLGILICGSGNGISMAANKHAGVRAALCWLPQIAELARQHNDANIVSLPARFIDETTALNIVDVFISTDFEGGRHQKRVEKVACS